MGKLSAQANKFVTSLDKMLNRLQTKVNLALVKTKKFTTNNLTLESGVVHVYTGNGISNLTIKYPKGDFISTVIFSTAKSGTIYVSFPPDTKFAGLERMKFYPCETWELNIHNGRVAGTLLT